MNRDTIEIKSKLLIQHALEGYEIESLKIDFKRIWYDLTTPNGKSEFIKDCSAIANTIGLDGFIIIGFDDKTKSFYNCKFSDSNLKDTYEVQNIIIRHCSNIFTVNVYDFVLDEHALSVLHIPPVLDKPIVVLNHKSFELDGTIKREEQHRIYVRKGTRNDYATKADIDLMYYDRNNLVPDYECLLEVISLNFGSQQSHGNNKTLIHNFATLILNIENFGRRNIPIKSTELAIDSDSGKFQMKGVRLVDEKGNRWELKPVIDIVKPNENKVIHIYYSESQLQQTVKSIKVYSVTLVLILTNAMRLVKHLATDELKLLLNEF